MCAREGEGFKVMERQLSKWFGILAVLALVAPAGAFAQGTASVKGLVKDSSGGSIPGAVVKVVSENGATVEAVTDGEGAFAAASLAAGAYRVEASLDGFETAVRRVALAAGQLVDVELTLAPAGITEGVVVTARRSEEVAQEVPIPLSVVERQADGRGRRLQREPSEGAHPDGAVLLDQPAQLVDQHPRPRRAVRSDQRRHRAGRRPLHRRRVLRAPGVGHSRLRGRRAHRGPARPAGHAVRQEHHVRRHQRHHAQADASAPRAISR